jgi:dTDP-L-rhamnose 4-epimerase
LIRNGKAINIFEDGKESRDFVFIDDVVAATSLAINNDAANSQTFNVGTGKPTTVMQVAQALVKAYGKEVELKISGNYRLGDIRHNMADISKIGRLLNFKPVVDFEAGIDRFARWVSTQEIGAGKYEESIREMAEKGLLKR